MEKEKFTEKMFEIALNARNFEIKMFWQRCNYFLLLNTAVGTAFAAAFAGGNSTKFFIMVVPIIGMFVCFAWIKVGLGAKFWQSYWEQVLIDFQGEVGFDGGEESEKVSNEKNIFSRPDYAKHVCERVKGNLDDSKNPPEKLYCSNFYDNSVMKKPSVSRWMHYTACFFFCFWLIAFVFALIMCFPMLNSLVQRLFCCG